MIEYKGEKIQEKEVLLQLHRWQYREKYFC